MKKYAFKLDNGNTITVKPPTYRQFECLRTACTDGEIIRAVADMADYEVHELTKVWTIDDIRRFIIEFPAWLNAVRNIDINLKVPYAPEDEPQERLENFEIKTSDLKIVADYARISILDAEKLDLFQYWGLLHDAVVWNCRRSESGRQYLESAWVFCQDKPDRKKLRIFFGGEKHGKQEN
ncbi:MAG: hypothetical protein IJX77_06150 [Ruminococcus sp.]|nr:hypothetical protein [Ruminococcus sp.]